MANQHAYIPDAYYTVLWLRMARARSGQNYSNELDDNVKKLGAPIWRKMTLESLHDVTDEILDATLKPWPGPLIGLYLGKVTPDTIHQEIEKIDDPAIRKRYACELDFYEGERSREKPALEDAKSFLRKAASDCPPYSVELGYAKAELALLERSTKR